MRQGEAYYSVAVVRCCREMHCRRALLSQDALHSRVSRRRGASPSWMRRRHQLESVLWRLRDEKKKL